MIKSLMGWIFIFSSVSASAASLTYLTGNTYKNYAEQKVQKEIITIEHFGVWDYGSLFFYYDISRPSGQDEKSEFFGGISPFFSLSKMTKRDFSFGPVTDVNLKFELEHVSGLPPVYFYGFSFDLKVPRFDFVSVAPVLRDDPNKPGVGGQLNAAWQLPFRFSRKLRFIFRGFVSAGVIPEADDSFFYVTQPQLTLDLGPTWGGEPNKVELGVEYSLAQNRFLKKGTLNADTGLAESGFDEQVLQAMLRMNY